ncbi:meiotic nuclear division protein 1 homolog isoform X2 [Teleopsis dalmanni]|nr:meiotic nuclear division protein 1 homolog isoform X2 [Teleopsis dalmanni]
MSKRKALSAEEKSVKMLEIFHESSSVFQLKELERIAPKEKHIVVQSVKSTLEELVNNGQVHSEKIAGSIYYWSFPSENFNTIKNQLKEKEAILSKLLNKIEIATEQLQSSTNALENSADTDTLQTKIATLKKDKIELEKLCAAAIADYDHNDITQKANSHKALSEAVNRWTDNIFNVKMWCKRKFDKQGSELDKAFGIPEDLDYMS